MQWHDWLSFIIGLIGVAVIIWGVIRGLWEFATSQILYLRDGTTVPLDDIRFEVGRYLLLGLEFFIAADVVHTIVQPTLEEVAVLGAIVIIRTIISYFLTHEIAFVEGSQRKK